MNEYTFYKDDVRDGRLFIGSSDLPVIVKTKKTKLKKSKRDLWLEKREMIEGSTGNEATRWGHELEPLVISRFIMDFEDEMTAYKFKVDQILHQNYRTDDYEPPTDFIPYTEAHAEIAPWAVAHADALYVGDKSEPFLIEAKTGRYFARIARDDMEGFVIDEDDDLPDTEKIPIEVMLQVQWQMLCYNVNLTYVLLFCDNQYFCYKIPAYRKWWPLLLEQASVFYNQCKTGEEPTPEKKEDVFSMFPELKDRASFVTGIAANIAEDMKAEKKKLGRLIKKYKAKRDDINDAAGLLLRDNRYLYNGETGQKLFSQSKYMKQGSISPKDLEENDRIKYEKLGIIKPHEERRIN